MCEREREKQKDGLIKERKEMRKKGRGKRWTNKKKGPERMTR